MISKRLKLKKKTNGFPKALLPPSLKKILNEREDSSETTKNIDIETLKEIREEYLFDKLQRPDGYLSEIEKEIVTSISNSKLITDNINEKYSEVETASNKLSEFIAKFAGSWIFVLVFGGLILSWVAININPNNKIFDIIYRCINKMTLFKQISF